MVSSKRYVVVSAMEVRNEIDRGITQHTRLLVVLTNADDLVDLLLLKSTTDNDEVLL